MYIFVGVAWVSFLVYWLISATMAKKSVNKMSWGAAVRLLLAVLVIVLLRLQFFDHAAGTVHSVPLEVIGVALMLAGMALAVWARVYIGKNWGMPMSHVVGRELVMTGPYCYIRHPIYTGFLLAILGTALAINLYLLILLFAVAIYMGYSAALEERTLAHEFSKTYPKYKAKSKMLIPFIF